MQRSLLETIYEYRTYIEKCRFCVKFYVKKLNPCITLYGEKFTSIREKIVCFCGSSWGTMAPSHSSNKGLMCWCLNSMQWHYSPHSNLLQKYGSIRMGGYNYMERWPGTTFAKVGWEMIRYWREVTRHNCCLGLLRDISRKVTQHTDQAGICHIFP